MTNSNDKANPSRRDFLKTSAVAVSATVATTLINNAAYAAGSDEIRIGVIGCGGRGTGAVENAFNSAPGVKLVAMGDVFKDRLNESRANLAKKPANVEKMAVKDDHYFSGLDAYEKVINAKEVNYLILATPPGFRPAHLKAAVAAGKHIFTEKPVAVDGAGIRSVLATFEESKAKNLGIAAGTQRRHQTGYIETMKRIHDGAIGEIVAARCYWNQGGLWKKERQEGWSDLEWQLRNWLYFTWLSGDHIVEQHVHNIDVVNWAMKGHPVSAMGMGGRQSRTSPDYGHIYDHFAIDYEYESGMHLMSMSRQIVGAANNVSEALVGNKGTCKVDRYQITGPKAWQMPREQGNTPDPYVNEHTHLIASIRAGKPINELKNVAESTLTAIMGRMSAYTGKVVTWDQALNSTEELVPVALDWKANMEIPAVAIPGQTELK